MKLINRFEDETINLKGVAYYEVAPRFKEIRVHFNNGVVKNFSAITYEIVEE